MTQEPSTCVEDLRRGRGPAAGSRALARQRALARMSLPPPQARLGSLPRPVPSQPAAAAPCPAQSLPAAAQRLPAAAQRLPAAAQSLPAAAQSLPAAAAAAQNRPAPTDAEGGWPVENCDIRQLMPTFLLLLICECADHGYDLIRRLSDFGFPDQDPARVYRVLRGLEERGLVTSSWQTHGAGAARRCYRATARGLAEMEAERVRVRALAGLLGQLLDRVNALPRTPPDGVAGRGLRVRPVPAGVRGAP